MNNGRWIAGRSVLLALTLVSGGRIGGLPDVSASEGEATGSFYKGPALFSTRPSETTSLQTIARFGPVGMGLDLVQPAFGMLIHNVEEGSPAAETGKLKAGQIIESINGQKLKDVDPRFQLGQIIADAEAGDGALRFVVKDKPEAAAEEITVKIPALGAYARTWPLNCPKSARIVRNFAAYLAGHNKGGRGLNGPEVLFLLSTGEEQDLDLVRQWLKGREGGGNYAWFIGYEGVPVAEYYLRTGDASVLPALKKYADAAREIYYCGGWAGRGTGNFGYMGGGHMNAAGTHVVTFLLLAKECGVDVDETTLQGALRQFYRFAGRGLNPYGDGRPEAGYVDNGKCGSLAFAMAAAASLTPDGENSVYALARDVSALKSFYTTPWMLHGHTGGGIGEIWRSAAMGLLYERRPQQYRDFRDSRVWWHELSRRHDGSFGVLGGGGYDKPDPWGVVMALTYTVPRKTLQITGAPRSKHAHPYRLPARPWGTAADDAFLSLKPAVDKNGRSPAVETETLAETGANRILERLGAADVSEETVRTYAHHQDHEIRRSAAMRAAGMIPKYMFSTPSTNALYPALVVELLQSKDPRIRWAGAYAVNSLPGGLLTDESFGRLMGMIEDPNESWWVVDIALQAVSHGKPESLAPHAERLLQWLQADDWWLANSAVQTLAALAVDERYCAQVFPVLGRAIAANQRCNTLSPMIPLAAKLQEAPPKVQQTALEVLARSYAAFPQQNPRYKEVPNVNGEAWHLEHIAAYMAGIPGGLDKLYEISRKRFPEQALSYRTLFLQSGDLESNPKVKEVLAPLIKDELTAEYVGMNRVKLLNLAAVEKQSWMPGAKSDELNALADLYGRAGVRDYDWHPFGPNLREAEWSYCSFDPIPAEQVPWDQLIGRYRKVTLPKGLERWNLPDFDPAAAGWKRGCSPFGQYLGEVPQQLILKCSDTCVGPTCYGATPVKTLWEKEVLLLRGTFKFPRVREGHRYRFFVDGASHVGTGGGYAIYVNGRLLIEQPEGTGRGGGEQVKGAFITREFLQDFDGKEVTIAVASFLRFNNKYATKPTERAPQGKLSLHMEEMKLPPLDQAELVRSATVVPMLSSAWQAKQTAENAEFRTDRDKFLYVGKFVANPTVLGSWTVVDQVKACEEFAPDKKKKPGRTPFPQVDFRDGGVTDHPLRIWSGDTLMDLARNEALRMTLKSLDGADYLFVEAGGFSEKNPEGWTSPLLVMKRAAK